MGCGCKNNQQAAQQQQQQLEAAKQQQTEAVNSAVKQTIEKYYQKPKGQTFCIFRLVNKKGEFISPFFIFIGNKPLTKNSTMKKGGGCGCGK